MLAYQYLQTLPQIAQGDANKMWILPSEFSKALDGLSRLGGGGDGEPGWLEKTTSPEAAASAAHVSQSEPMDTTGWFDSNLPPATSLPETANLRASDTTEDSLEAHSGLMPDEPELSPMPPMPGESVAGPGGQTAGYAYPKSVDEHPPGYAYPNPFVPPPGTPGPPPQQ